MIFNDEYVYLNVSNQNSSKLLIEGYVKNPLQYNKMLVFTQTRM